ncbi:uncharacterized protein TNCV_4138651 [Trichonephila clavipes]|nr:uncharacterized protein TNCV_4138651 [Trichonephila clavipes]
MRCAAFPFEMGFHFRRKTDFFPEEDTTKSYSGFEPEPTRLQAEDFVEDIRLSESECEESEESVVVIDNILVNPDIYVARDGTEGIPYNGNIPGEFVNRNVLQQNSGPTSSTKHNAISFYDIKVHNM